MSAAPADDEYPLGDLDDLLPDDLSPAAVAKHKAVPLRRTPAQIKAAEKRAEAQAEADSLRAAATATQAKAAQLAQIVNLHIAGHSLADIGASIGASADEIDRMLNDDVARYVRTQPALRIYVRNWISSKYTAMIEADWKEANDVNSPAKLENQDRVMRMLDKMGKLHGAEAPLQSEVKIDAAPEAVERLVNALASTQGLGYDMDVFDIEVVSDTTVHDAAQQSLAALESASQRVEESDGNDSL